MYLYNISNGNIGAHTLCDDPVKIHHVLYLYACFFTTSVCGITMYNVLDFSVFNCKGRKLFR
jgi:hypothetical protein